MSSIEPTEEQKQAARDLYNNLLIDFNMGADIRPPEALARLLAEREAKLTARIDDLTERSARRLDDSTAIDALVYAIACLELQPGSERDRAVRDALNRVINHVGAIEVRARDSATKVVSALVAGAKAREDALTTRVAELEGQVSESTRLRMTETLHGMGVEAGYQEREAQHLADIKALMGCCRGLVHDVDRLMCGIDVGRHAMVMRATLQRLAHCDDAKAAEGGEG